MMRLADHVSWRLRSGGTASCSFLLGCIPSRGNILNNVGAPEHTSQSYGTGFFLKKLVYTCTIGSEFFAHILLSLRSNNFFFYLKFVTPYLQADIHPSGSMAADTFACPLQAILMKFALAEPCGVCKPLV